MQILVMKVHAVEWCIDNSGIPYLRIQKKVEITDETQCIFIKLCQQEYIYGTNKYKITELISRKLTIN